ncbi:STAS domain-containing protein [Streptomyces sp. NPDC006739]|uniref:STAS domain-containing protein n=1 Tax=Streptomyces sp. NPDC006739 TaxID=3364763 RepID=UPI0036778BAE
MSGAGGITTLVARDGEVTSMAVFGELDTFTGNDLVGVLLEQCLVHRPARVVVDLSAVSFCDGAGARALAQMRELAARAGTEFAVTGARSPTLLRVLEIMGLDLLFRLDQDPTRHPGSASR